MVWEPLDPSAVPSLCQSPVWVSESLKPWVCHGKFGPQMRGCPGSSEALVPCQGVGLGQALSPLVWAGGPVPSGQVDLYLVCWTGVGEGHLEPNTEPSSGGAWVNGVGVLPLEKVLSPEREPRSTPPAALSGSVMAAAEGFGCPAARMLCSRCPSTAWSQPLLFSTEPCVSET